MTDFLPYIAIALGGFLLGLGAAIVLYGRDLKRQDRLIFLQECMIANMYELIGRLSPN